MLFNFSEKFKESNKERNVYAKLFAGCIFNDFIPQNSKFELAKKFFEKLIYRYTNTCEEFEITPQDTVIKHLDGLQNDEILKNLHVDFDHHAERELPGIKDNKGEISDIFITAENILIGIEAKVFSNWDFKKDIIDEQKRIQCVSKRYGVSFGRIHVLLVTKQKWDEVKSERQTKRAASQYNLLKQHIRKDDSMPFIWLRWEDLIEITWDIKTVSAYLQKILREK